LLWKFDHWHASSFVLSIIEQSPQDLQEKLDDLQYGSEHQGQRPAWMFYLLCGALSSAIDKSGSLRLKYFIDAVDECDEEEVRTMADFFESFDWGAVEGGTEVRTRLDGRH